MELHEFLEDCLKMSESAYQQEVDRQRAIGEKLDYLFRWLTIFVTVCNIGIPLTAKVVDETMFTGQFWGLYGLLTALLVSAMILIFIIQFPRKQKYFPLGTELLRKVKESRAQYQDRTDWIYQQILYLDNMTKKLVEKKKSDSNTQEHEQENSVFSFLNQHDIDLDLEEADRDLREAFQAFES